MLPFVINREKSFSSAIANMYFLKQYKDKSSTNKNDYLVPEGKNREKGIMMETKPL